VCIIALAQATLHHIMLSVVDQNMMAAISSTENEVYKGPAESEASLTDFSGYVGKK
jgi:hypothetical protein